MGLFQNIIGWIPPVRKSNIIQQGEGRWWTPTGSRWATGTIAGEEVTDASLLTSSTCYACTKVLAESVAGLPTAIMQRMQKVRRETPDSHPAFSLLCESPNPEMDSFTFMELVVNRTINTGNFFAEIERDRRDRPVALWPIHPTRVTPMRDAEGMLFWQISSDYSGAPEYADASWRKQNLRFLSPHNMLNVVGFGSLNGIIGPGISPGAQEIGVDFAVRRYGADFFRNGAVPLGFVEHPGWIADPIKRENFRSDLNRIHSSSRHTSGVLWEGAKYNQIGISPESAQMLETRRYTAHQLCYMYGVPPPIIGDYQDSKFATADAMIRFFVMMTIRNLVVRIERAVNRQVMHVRNQGAMKKAFDSNLIYQIVLDGLLRGDPETQAKVWETMRKNGVATANDWLQDVGMNPIEGPEGEYRIVPGGYVRLENIDNQGDRLANGNNTAPVSDNSNDDASLPSFDREKLVTLIEPMVQRTPAVQGSDITLRATKEVSLDALTRIHQITLTQIERWREQDPKLVSEKLPGFWQKQRDRLADALQVVDRIADNLKVADRLADAYVASLSGLDNYDIFDPAKTNIDFNELVDQCVSY